MNRMYVVDGFEYNRKEFIDFLLTLIHENGLYNLCELSNATTEGGIERRVKNRPLGVLLFAHVNFLLYFFSGNE